MAAARKAKNGSIIDSNMEWAHTVVSAIALYAFLFYAQFLAGVQGNLWLSSLILWLLISVVFIFSPFLRKILREK